MRKPRLSLASILLLTTIVALAVSHVITSQKLVRVQNEMNALLVDLRPFGSQTDDRMFARILPTQSPQMLWRWKIQLPEKGRYRLRSLIGDVPATGYPAEGGATDPVFHKDFLLLDGGSPSLLSVQISNYNKSGKWEILAKTPDRQLCLPIVNMTPWLVQRTGYTIAEGMDEMKTQSADVGQPLQLIRMRKAASVSGAVSPDPNPTDGILLWIERIEDISGN